MSTPSFFDVRMRGFRDRAAVTTVVQLIDRRIQARPAEIVALTEAGYRVLADDVRAGVDVPAFDRAAMDGYALRAGETTGATANRTVGLTIIGEALPARPCP